MGGGALDMGSAPPPRDKLWIRPLVATGGISVYITPPPQKNQSTLQILYRSSTVTRTYSI